VNIAFVRRKLFAMPAGFSAIEITGSIRELADANIALPHIGKHLD
jgi:hypothetical protein